MPVSDDLKLIFVHIPKNAGTSIEKSLKGMGGKYSGHYPWGTYATHVSEKWKDYTTFSVVRNPWDRVVSNYVYARKEESYWHSAKNPEQSRMGKHFDYDTLKNKSFEETVSILGELEHQGWSSQYQYICDSDLNVKVDYILKMEALEKDMEEMFKKENIKKDFSLKEVNVTREEKSYREWFNSETKEKVENYYKTDVELFDYKF